MPLVGVEVDEPAGVGVGGEVGVWDGGGSRRGLGDRLGLWAGFGDGDLTVLPDFRVSPTLGVAARLAIPPPARRGRRACPGTAPGRTRADWRTGPP